MIKPLAVLTCVLVLITALGLSEVAASTITRMTRAVLQQRLDRHRKEFSADLEAMLAKYDAPIPHRSEVRIFPEWNSMSASAFILERVLSNDSGEEACRFAAIIISLIADSLSVTQLENLTCEFFRCSLGRKFRGIIPLSMHLIIQHNYSPLVYEKFVSYLHVSEARKVLDRISTHKHDEESDSDDSDDSDVDTEFSLSDHIQNESHWGGYIHYYLMIRSDTRNLYLDLHNPKKALYIIMMFAKWDFKSGLLIKGFDPQSFATFKKDTPVEKTCWSLRMLMPPTGLAPMEHRRDIVPILARLVATSSSHLLAYRRVLNELVACEFIERSDVLWTILVNSLTSANQPLSELGEILFNFIAKRAGFVDVLMSPDSRKAVAALWLLLSHDAQRLAISRYPILRQFNWPIQEKFTTAYHELVYNPALSLCCYCGFSLFCHGLPNEWHPEFAEGILADLAKFGLRYITFFFPREHNRPPFLLTKILQTYKDKDPDTLLVCSTCAIAARQGGSLTF